MHDVGSWPDDYRWEQCFGGEDRISSIHKSVCHTVYYIHVTFDSAHISNPAMHIVSSSKDARLRVGVIIEASPAEAEIL